MSRAGRAEDVLDHIRPGDDLVVAMAAGEPASTIDALEAGASRLDGSTLWTGPGGHAAVANFDIPGADPAMPEIVVVHSGTVSILHPANGTAIWSRSGVLDAYGGPPTVADFDGDAYRALYANLVKLGTRPWVLDRADCAAFVQRLAALRQPAGQAATPAPLPSLIPNKVDCHDR